MVRAPSIYVPDLTIDSFDASVNDDWMEALDVGSGRLYFVQLEKNASGDSVKPSGETSWEPPKGFLVRQQLVHALARALAAGDDASFLSRVRERFPPPSTPPPGNAPVAATAATAATAADAEELARLRAQVAQLESDKAALLTRAETAEASIPQLPPRPPMLGEMSKPGSWKGASQRFGTIAEQPPEPPLGRWQRRRAASGPTLKGHRWTTSSTPSRRNPHSTGGSPAASDVSATHERRRPDRGGWTARKWEMLSQIDRKSGGGGG